MKRSADLVAINPREIALGIEKHEIFVQRGIGGNGFAVLVERHGKKARPEWRTSPNDVVERRGAFVIEKELTSRCSLGGLDEKGLVGKSFQD